MAKGSDVPSSFAELIEQHQRTPSPPGRGRDISSPFGMPLPADHRVVDLKGDGSRAPGSPEYDYEAHVRFLTLPDEAAAYEEIINKCLKGEGILRAEDKNFTKDGDFVVVVTYLTFKPSARRAGRLRREEEEDRRD